jgi:hypothetical protein
MFSAIIYFIPLVLGAVLSWQAFVSANTRKWLFSFSIFGAVFALVFAGFDTVEAPSNPAISLGAVLLWPVLVVVCSSLAIRRVAAQQGTQDRRAEDSARLS